MISRDDVRNAIGARPWVEKSTYDQIVADTGSDSENTGPKKEKSKS